MLTCSFDVLLPAGSLLHSAVAALLCTIIGLGCNLEKAWHLQQMGSSEAIGYSCAGECFHINISICEQHKKKMGQEGGPLATQQCRIPVPSSEL
jgi:hypothetical protein